MRTIKYFMYITFACFLLITSIKAQEGVFDNLMNYPLRLITEDKSFGSGILFQDSLNGFLITARHILFTESTVKVNNKAVKKYTLKGDSLYLLVYGFSSSTGEVNSREYVFSLSKISDNNGIIYSNNHDIAIVRVADKVYNQEVLVFRNFYKILKKTDIIAQTTDVVKKFDEITPGDDVYLFGYPASLGSRKQFDIDKPLLRRGVIAGKNADTQTLILDCTAYPGNSGGPVIVAKQKGNVIEYRLAGIVTEVVPFIDTFESKHYKFKNIVAENSGLSVAVSTDVALELIEEYYKRNKQGGN